MNTTVPESKVFKTTPFCEPRATLTIPLPFLYVLTCGKQKRSGHLIARNTCCRLHGFVSSCF